MAPPTLVERWIPAFAGMTSWVWRLGWLVAGTLATPALAQEAGWHYSPLPGEGDRAALGCNREATVQAYVCLAVRCEDDFGTGLYLHSDRLIEAGNSWSLTIDREFALPLELSSTTAPYSARVEGEVVELIDGLRNGGIAYLDATDGSVSAQIRLAGSLQAINQALYFCAPKVSGDEVAPVDGQDDAGDEAGEGTAEE